MSEAGFQQYLFSAPKRKAKCTDWDYRRDEKHGTHPFYLKVLLDVFSVVGDATGCDAGLPHQLEADLSAQEVWDLALLSNTHQTQSSVRS